MKATKRKKVSEVIGVIHPIGAMVVGDGKRFSELWFRFASWREVNGVINETELQLEKAGRERDLDAIKAELKPFKVFRARVRLRIDEWKRTFGVVVGSLKQETNDREMIARAKELRKPVKYHDGFFGEFTLDRSVDWFEADTSWNSVPVKLNLAMEKAEDLPRLIATARLLWRAQKSWDKRIRNFAVAKMLALKNGEWLANGERRVTAIQFKSRMKIRSITVEPGGKFQFWYDDGDLFGGNIVIEGSVRRGPTSWDIPG